MKNWSVDENTLRRYPEKYRIWKLEQLINFGISKEKLPLKSLKKYINKLNIDPLKKRYLKFLMK